MRIDQVIPTLDWPDAIGTHTVALTAALRAAGIDSDIFYGRCADPGVASLGRPLNELGPFRPERALLYQSSIGSPVQDVVLGRDEPILVNYHNMTPAELLAPWEPAVAAELRLGRRQLAELAPRCVSAVADSEYNRAELEALGYRHTSVGPLLMDTVRPDTAPDPDVLTRLRRAREDGGVDLLFIGKISPHKAPHDLVKAVLAYRRVYGGHVRLHLVGSPLGSRYIEALREYIATLDLEDAVELAGPVSGPGLEAYFSCSDAFVCLSDHEGFCVPIIEAMAHGVPVVAYANAAVPETVADAGILLESKDPMVVAAAIHRVVSDPTLARRLADAGKLRLVTFEPQAAAARMVAAVTERTGL